jgi:hypothetical protein
MAKKHLKIILGKLKRYYEEAETLYSNFALDTQDMIISDDTMEPLLAQKIILDNTLILYSTGIRAAMYNMLSDVLGTERRSLSAFNEPLLLAVNNLSDDPQNDATKAIIQLYNKSIKALKTRISALEDIKFFKDLPNRKQKENKIFSTGKISFVEKVKNTVEEPIREQIEVMDKLYKEFLASPVEESGKGDLEE